MFLDRKDAEIARVIWNYFSAIATRWPESWNSVDTVGNILPRTTGFNALMRLLPHLYNHLGGAGSIPKLDDFLNILHNSNIEDGEFSKDDFLPGGSGVVALYEKLKDSILDEREENQSRLFN